MSMDSGQYLRLGCVGTIVYMEGLTLRLASIAARGGYCVEGDCRHFQ